MYQIIDDGLVRVQLTHWAQRIDLQQTYQNIKATKVLWLSFQTVNTGNTELSLLCDELKGNGFYPKNDKSNVRFLLSMPLDQSAPVSCVYSNYTNHYDKTYSVPVNLVVLNFEVYVNGLPAIEISESNPVDFLLALYA